MTRNTLAITFRPSAGQKLEYDFSCAALLTLRNLFFAVITVYYRIVSMRRLRYMAHGGMTDKGQKIQENRHQVQVNGCDGMSI